MIVSLCRDAARVNAVANDPAIRPFIGLPDAGELDFAGAVARPENWFLMGKFGGFALIWTAPRCYEVHTFILPAGRGQWARRAAACGIEYARANGAARLWTRVPEGMPHVRAYARGMGMRATGEAIETGGKMAEIMEMELGACQQHLSAA